MGDVFIALAADSKWGMNEGIVNNELKDTTGGDQDTVDGKDVPTVALLGSGEVWGEEMGASWT